MTRSTTRQSTVAGRTGRPRRGYAGRRGYPAEVRAQAIGLIRARQALGIGLGACAAELGISTVTLRKWLQAADSGEGNQATPATAPRCQLVPAAPAPSWRPVMLASNAGTAHTSRGLHLVTPSGYRLEGLTLEQALTALENLR